MWKNTPYEIYHASNDEPVVSDVDPRDHTHNVHRAINLGKWGKSKSTADKFNDLMNILTRLLTVRRDQRLNPSLVPILDQIPYKFERITDKTKALEKIQSLVTLLVEKIGEKDNEGASKLINLFLPALDQMLLKESAYNNLSRPAKLRRNMNNFATNMMTHAVGLRKRVFGWGGTRRRQYRKTRRLKR